jgi:small subunit ribosomal protein S13
MPRLVGVDIPAQKKLKIALQYIYGIGKHNSSEILDQAQVDGEKRANTLTTEEIGRLQRVIEKIRVEGELRKKIREDIERLRRVASYRGIRHVMGLPVRGQRTRVNARTRRGKRKTVGAMTKEMAEKLDKAKSGK